MNNGTWPLVFMENVLPLKRGRPLTVLLVSSSSSAAATPDAAAEE